MAVNVDDVIKKYISVREERKELKRQYEMEDEILKEKLKKMEQWFLANQRAAGVTQFKSDSGVVFQTTRTLFTCVDWGTFHNWIIENKRVDLLEKRVLQGGMKEFREETGTIPPGLNVYSEVEINVRKGS